MAGVAAAAKPGVVEHREGLAAHRIDRTQHPSPRHIRCWFRGAPGIQFVPDHGHAAGRLESENRLVCAPNTKTVFPLGLGSDWL